MPAPMSPPTRFALCASISAGVMTESREHAVTESRREPLDLPLDAVEHVHGGCPGHVAIAPRHMPADGRAGWIELFAGSAARTAGDNSSFPCAFFGRRDLAQRATQVHRTGASAFVGFQGIGAASAQST